jgi:hypothetical protein
MLKRAILGVLLSSSLFGFTQQEGWMSFPSKTDSVSLVKKELDYSQSDGVVTLHQDERLEKIEKFVRAGEGSLEGVLIDGFRVLIYFDQDKTKSEQQKAHFMNMYNEHSTYIDYLAPNYRVRVGNFRTKLEAEKLKQDIIAVFPTAIVVSDKIQLPVLKGIVVEEEK